MSNELGTIQGRYEQRHDVATLTTIYDDADLHVVSFWGGDAWKSCVQLTIHQSDGTVAYVQLNIPRVRGLVHMLADWLEGKG